VLAIDRARASLSRSGSAHRHGSGSVGRAAGRAAADEHHRRRGFHASHEVAGAAAAGVPAVGAHASAPSLAAAARAAGQRAATLRAAASRRAAGLRVSPADSAALVRAAGALRVSAADSAALVRSAGASAAAAGASAAAALASTVGAPTALVLAVAAGASARAAAVARAAGGRAAGARAAGARAVGGRAAAAASSGQALVWYPGSKPSSATPLKGLTALSFYILHIKGAANLTKSDETRGKAVISCFKAVATAAELEILKPAGDITASDVAASDVAANDVAVALVLRKLHDRVVGRLILLYTDAGKSGDVTHTLTVFKELTVNSLSDRLSDLDKKIGEKTSEKMRLGLTAEDFDRLPVCPVKRPVNKKHKAR
jgi:hypothetical protein